MGLDSATVPRVASAFGGGGGGSGDMCGTLAGAFMAAGLVLGRNQAAEDNRALYKVAQQVHSGFLSEMGSSGCRELTGLDLRTREGARQLYESDVHERVCQRAARVATRLVSERLTAAASD